MIKHGSSGPRFYLHCLSSCFGFLGGQVGPSRGLLQLWFLSEPNQKLIVWAGGGAPLPIGPEFLLIGGARSARGVGSAGGAGAAFQVFLNG